MPIAASATPPPPLAFYRLFDTNDALTESVKRPQSQLIADLTHASGFWQATARIAEAWRRLDQTRNLLPGWDTYGAEPPNESARVLAADVLSGLDSASLPPSGIMPSAEGGIVISFVNGDHRAAFEAYNTNELVAAMYGGGAEPIVWQVVDTKDSLAAAIDRIRVHLAS